MEEKMYSFILLSRWLEAIDCLIHNEWNGKFDIKTFTLIYDLLPYEMMDKGHEYYPKDELLCAYLNRGQTECVDIILKVRTHNLNPITKRDIIQQERIRRIKLPCGEYFRTKNMM